tara:strand:+ start:3215 stop:3400 length:186 start_codon:yes stop_codon:yes gene_type:complete
LITIVLFDEYGHYEVSLKTNDPSDVELQGYAMREYESAVAGIATQYLDMQTNSQYYIGTEC